MLDCNKNTRGCSLHNYDVDGYIIFPIVILMFWDFMKQTAYDYVFGGMLMVDNMHKPLMSFSAVNVCVSVCTRIMRFCWRKEEK